MKIILAIVITLWHLEKTTAVKKWTSFKVTNDLFTRAYPEAFIDLPQTTDDACLMDFEIVRTEKEFCYHLHLFCLRDDPRLCLFFDWNGSIAGMQISYLESDVSNVDETKYNFSQPNFIKTNFFNIPAYSFRVYFANPRELPRKNTSEVAEGLWAELDGKLVKFDSRCQLNSPVIGDFDMQGCYAKIGQVFARKFNEKSVCKNVFFVYLLYEGNSMIGFGHGIPGFGRPGPRYDVYNHPSGAPFQELLPNPPPCLYELYSYGFSVVNIYFVEDPWNIRCPKCHCS